MPDESQDQSARIVGVNAKVQLPPVAELPPATYANYVAATHSDFEVLLDFAQMALPTSEQELRSLGDNPTILAKHVARIAIPHAVLEPLIKVLTQRLDIIATIAKQTASEDGESTEDEGS